MKILITTDLYSVSTNGVVTLVNNLFDELRSKGHDVRVLTLSWDCSSFVQDKVYYIRAFSLDRIYPELRGSLAVFDRLSDELIEWKPDVIHSQCEFFTFRFARHISKRTDSPIVHTYHTLYENYVGYIISNKLIGKNLVRMYSKQCLRHVSAVIAPSTITSTVLKGYGVEQNISIIPPGIALEQHQQRSTEEEIQELRYRYRIAENAFVMLYLGRLGVEKNIDELMIAFSWFVDERPDTVLFIVGDGPARGGLEDWAEHLHINDNVVFAGAVPQHEVHRYYQIADVFVSASTSETQGLVYVEAAANGLPLVCRKAPCLQGIIAEGENGFVFETVKEFETAVLCFQNDRIFRNKASDCSRDIARRFDKRHLADAVERVYQSVTKTVRLYPEDSFQRVQRYEH
ncbi:glycosyltransferase [Sphaerochaeta pleomorpha str. Grapes]|uniref:Glycosyltransferase n=1 Tax=Sphaerochaeta pleomorpha (strain ATCC BAA-1885 / DSM 22778 / Grapes) TaxID=158190 RepID=G8QX54_SPHPG|nr:glycosyltransferase [Sphaerochaeta pleomorpha]AEV30639.1 glycosyltransferase [Sphaerochaeta pleomorpha str. Grapes]